MSEEIVRRRSPDVSTGQSNSFRPDELNADLAAASLARDLIAKLPTPAIDTRKFTIIHGLMKSLNHKDSTFDVAGKMTDPGNLTYIDTSMIVTLMDEVSMKSVNVGGELLHSIFAYLMKPKYIIQGMPSTQLEEKKPNVISRLIGYVTGKGASQDQAQS